MLVREPASVTLPPEYCSMILVTRPNIRPTWRGRGGGTVESGLCRGDSDGLILFTTVTSEGTHC